MDREHSPTLFALPPSSNSVIVVCEYPPATKRILTFSKKKMKNILLLFLKFNHDVTTLGHRFTNAAAMTKI